MKKAKKLLLVFTLCIYISPFAQVNLQTGAAEINIPLYSYEDTRNRIGTDLTLFYINGNGFKVNEIPASVGSGWELSCGGVISRELRGEPDDQKINYLTSTNYIYNPDYFPNGYLYTEFSPQQEIDNGGGYTPLFNGNQNYMQRPVYLADREQDLFNFSFNGRSGSFLIGKNGVIKKIIDSKLRIEFDTTDMFNSGVRTKISEFRVIDDDGIKYVFRDKELSEIIKYGEFSNSLSNFSWSNFNIYPSNNPPL